MFSELFSSEERLENVTKLISKLQQFILRVVIVFILVLFFRMADRVICSTLSIPLPAHRFSIDQLLESNESEKRRRLASLLNLPSPPTRASLVKDLVRTDAHASLSKALLRLGVCQTRH